MKDSAIPSISVQNDGISINITIPSTQAKVEEQNYTYNQAGFTYNQAGVAYGGIYNYNEDIVPIGVSFSDIYSAGEAPAGSSIGPGWFMFVTGI